MILADLLDRVRGLAAGAPRGSTDIVRDACLEPAPQLAPRPDVIPLCYFIGTRNIGDRISPITVEQATGRPTQWMRRPKGPHLIGLGSILTWSTPQSHIWGTGIMYPVRGVGGVRPERIWALRGKLTRDHVARQVTGLRDVPLGDPGWLLARHLATLTPRRAATHALGIVPHYLHRDHPGIAHLRQQDGVIVLDVRDPEPAFFAPMMACEAIASSSLHGLIFAEALGIPNVWLDIDTGHPERAFKYWDWFSLAEQPPPTPHQLGAAPAARDLIAQAALHDIKIDEAALRTAIPRRALDELKHSGFAAPRIVHALACRRRALPIFVICRGGKSRLPAAAAAYARQSMATEIIPLKAGNDLSRAIHGHFRRWGEPARYAVADDSIDFSIASSDALALYDEFLDRFPAAGGVGPMLRISDIPRSHPAFARIVSAEIAAHWCRPPLWHETSFGRVAFARSSLAGTFALYRAGEKYAGPGEGLRVHYPFEARKLGWRSVTSTSGNIGPVAERYHTVQYGTDGRLAAVERRVSENPA